MNTLHQLLVYVDDVNLWVEEGEQKEKNGISIWGRGGGNRACIHHHFHPPVTYFRSLLLIIVLSPPSSICLTEYTEIMFQSRDLTGLLWLCQPLI
jgi:hypothetical protein